MRAPGAVFIDLNVQQRMKVPFPLNHVCKLRFMAIHVTYYNLWVFPLQFVFALLEDHAELSCTDCGPNPYTKWTPFQSRGFFNVKTSVEKFSYEQVSKSTEP